MYMDAGYGHWISTLDMDTGYGHWIWTLDMDSGYGQFTWTVDIDTGYGEWIWRLGKDMIDRDLKRVLSKDKVRQSHSPYMEQRQRRM